MGSECGTTVLGCIYSLMGVDINMKSSSCALEVGISEDLPMDPDILSVLGVLIRANGEMTIQHVFF